MKIAILAAAFALSAVLGGSASALDAAKPAPSSSAAPAASTSEASARSAECSKQADAKNLHGKERKKFREDCKKGK